MNGKAKGARAERRVIRILEAAGYVCTKAGSSLGLFDVIANRPVGCALHSGEGERVSVSGRARIDQGAADAGQHNEPESSVIRLYELHKNCVTLTVKGQRGTMTDS